jgi:hypothetical protein
MSSVVISGDTSGAITLAAPAVAGTNTLTLPAITGNVITSADTGSVTKAMVNTSTANGFGLCRAWVKFNGSTATVNGSFNVSSVVRNSTGNYTVNFTTAMPNTNYAVVTGFQTPAWGTIVHAFSYTTSSFVWESGIAPTPTYIDTNLATAAVFSS